MSPENRRSTVEKAGIYVFPKASTAACLCGVTLLLRPQNRERSESLDVGDLCCTCLLLTEVTGSEASTALAAEQEADEEQVSRLAIQSCMFL